MQLRMYIPLLLLCTLLILLVTWQLLSPPESNSPTVPREASEEAAREGTQPELIDVDRAGVEEPSRPEILEKPPVAPEVVNDPAQGQIWFRLLDADSNRPIARTSCGLYPVRFNENLLESNFGWEAATDWRQTDAAGLLKLAASTGDEDAGDTAVRFADDESEFSEFPIPVPEGWYPAVHPVNLKSEVEGLRDEPRTMPIDLPLRRRASLTLTVRDPWGVPLPDAKVVLTGLVHFADPVTSWLEGDTLVSERVDPVHWPDGRDELIQMADTLSVKTTFHGARESSDLLDIREILNEVNMSSAESGRVSFTGLPQIGIGAVGWHPLYGAAAARVDLAAGENTLDVRLKPRVQTRLHVRVEWLLEDEDEYDSIFVSIESAGPYGLMDGVSEAGSARFYEYELPKNDTGIWTGTVSGLPPGCWLVTVGSGAEYGYTSRVVEVTPNADATANLYIGEAAASGFAPTLMLGDEPLEEFTFWIQGGEHYEPQLMDGYYDEEAGADVIDLVAGDYTVWIPTLPAQNISLKPGERLSPVYTLLGHEVTFTISERLAAALGGGPLELELEPLPESDDQGALMATYDAFWVRESRRKGREDELEEFRPGVAVKRWLPCGRYWWGLFADDELSGELRVGADGPESVHFDVDSLPGLACLQLHFAADMPEPDFYFDEGVSYDARIEAYQADDVGDLGGPDVEFPDEWLEEEVAVIRVSDREFLAFASPGVRTMGLEGPEREHEFTVEFPGERSFSATELRSRKLVQVEVVQAYNGPIFGLGFYAVHENGQEWHDYYGDSAEFPPGRLRFEVSEETWGERQVIKWATLEVELESEKIIVDLKELNYQEFGRVEFVFRGRGSPDELYDAWWFDPYREFTPLVECLDYPQGPMPRYVVLVARVEFGHAAPPERHLRGQLLPPGRYRVIPWKDAPEEYWREFTVPSGGRVEVVVDTAQ